MSNENLVPSIFEHEEFGQVRVVMIDGEAWFVAADICRALDLSDVSKTVSRLDDDEKGKSLILTQGGYQEMLVVNESGLYALVLTSRKPNAKKFRKWITSKVLPSIFRTGSYTLPSVATDLERERLEVEKLQLVTEQARLEVERDRLALEREQFTIANSDETKNFAKVQLLRELASASGDNQSMRNNFLKEARKLLIGEVDDEDVPLKGW